MINKISKKEKLESLDRTIYLNDICIDYMKNEVQRKKDLYEYSLTSMDLENYNTCKMILFSLEYLSETYDKAYRQLKG